MKAIVRDRYGDADVLEFRDLDVPRPGDQDVLLRVHAAGCGPDVWHIMTGKPYFARLALGLRTPKVKGLGWDVAGTVEAVGSAVTGFSVGDHVLGTAPSGSFAESAVTGSDKLVSKPSTLTFEQAAAVPISGVTALQALRDRGALQPGKRALIIGAAGGVGTLAVQMAKAFGGDVTAVCGGSKAALVRSIGADDVIDYTREDFTGLGRQWDLIVDTAGRRPLSRLRRALTPKGTLVVVGGDGGGSWTGGFFRGALRAPLWSLVLSQRLRGLNAKQKPDDLRTVVGMIEAGTVTPVIDRTYPLIEAPEALRYLEQGHPSGKVVITV